MISATTAASTPTSTSGVTSPRTSKGCESWCAVRARDWTTKCSWSKCAGCAECSPTPGHSQCVEQQHSLNWSKNHSDLRALSRLECYWLICALSTKVTPCPHRNQEHSNKRHRRPWVIWGWPQMVRVVQYIHTGACSKAVHARTQHSHLLRTHACYHRMFTCSRSRSSSEFFRYAAGPRTCCLHHSIWLAITSR